MISRSSSFPDQTISVGPCTVSSIIMATPPPEGAILEEKPQLPTSLEKVTADSALPRYVPSLSFFLFFSLKGTFLLCIYTYSNIIFLPTYLFFSISGDSVLDIKTAPVKPDPVISEINESAVQANTGVSTPPPVNGHHATSDPNPKDPDTDPSKATTNGVQVEEDTKKEDITMTNTSPRPTSSPKVEEEQTSFSEVPSSLDTVTKTTTDLSIAESGDAQSKENKADAKMGDGDGDAQGQNSTAEVAPQEQQSESPALPSAVTDEKPQEADAMDLSTDKPHESVSDKPQESLSEQPQEPLSDKPQELVGGNNDNNDNTSKEVPVDSKHHPGQELPQQPTDTATPSAPTDTATAEQEKPVSEDPEEMARLRSQGLEAKSDQDPTSNTPKLPQPAAEPAAEKPAPVDESMPDAPPSPSKPQRERDEDPGDERASKRAKTNGDEPNAPALQSSPSLAPPAANGTPPPGKPSSITQAQHKFLMKSMTSLKRMNDSRFFRDPVDIVKLNIPNYYSIIKHPMDLRTIEKTLRDGQYTSVEALISDFNTMVQNSVTFNGPDHIVSQEGLKLKATFERHMVNFPGPDVVEPTPADKKKKANHVSVKKAVVRREPRQTAANAPRAAATTTATNATSPTTFALGPEGLPLIRRDSTAADGRPKRSIHPPKNRELPYSSKPKKKKFQWELKFCQEVLDELHKPKHYNFASPFYYPVDPVALNIPTYHNIIKKPMDLSTVQTKLRTGQYENAKEMETDVRQIFKNCYKFNIPGDPTYTAGKKTEELFDTKWAQKNRWIEAHEPPSAQQSVGSSDEESDEHEAEESEDDQDHEKLTLLQKQIAEMSRQVAAITQKQKKTPPAPAKKATKSKATGKKDNKKGANTGGTAAANKKKAGKGGKAEKQRWITYHEKQLISNGISSLSDKKMQEALKIIQNNVPSLKVSLTSKL